MRSIIDKSTLHTVSGDTFCPLKDVMGKVEIGDIAWSLAHQCRFNGHVDRFYSVANHSMVMSRYFQDRNRHDLALQALLHDSAEAYLGDVVYPVKHLLPDFIALENRVVAYIMKELGLNEFLERDNDVLIFRQDPEVSKLDRRMCSHETAILRSSITGPEYQEDIGDLYDMPPEMMAGQFEVMFENLMDKREEGW